MLYTFAGFRLDTIKRQLTDVDGRETSLPPRALDALLLFVERPGILRDRRSLISALWPDTFVEDNSLDQIISQLRRLQGNGAHEQLIATEKGRGYRFVATVERCVEHASATLSDSDNAQQLFRQARILIVRPSGSNLEGAFGLLSAALELQPSFPEALAERALLRTIFPIFEVPYEKDPLSEAEVEARQALQLDPRLGRAYHALANICVERRRWIEARNHYTTACELEPEPNALITRVWHLSMTVGHTRLALEQAKEVQQILPHFPLTLTAVAAASSCLGQHEQAAINAEQAAKLGWPRWQAPLLDIRFRSLLHQRLYPEAADCIRVSLTQRIPADDAANLAGQIGAALEYPRQQPGAVTALQTLIAGMGVENLGHQLMRRMLVWLSLLNAQDAAFRCLDHILDDLAKRDAIGNPWDMLWIPEMGDFRRDRRFRSVIDRFGFRDYWRIHGPPDDTSGV